METTHRSKVSTRLREVAWIVGCPQSGKTTLAVSLAARLSRERRVPVLVVDSAEVHNLASVPRASIKEAIRACWESPRGNARLVPRDLREMNRICSVVRAGGNIVLLVDEANFWLSAQSGVSGDLTRLMRATQHAQVDVILTTQHLTGDVPQVALSCTSALYVFRCTAPRVLQTLEREFGMDRAAIASLPQFSYIPQRIGFE